MAKIQLPEMRVKLNEPADMAAAIPHLVGFEPEESLVVVSMRGRRKRIGLTMRFDLPPETCDADIAEQIAVRLAADGADFALVACCTAEQPVDGPHPRTALIQLVRPALAAYDIELLDALLIRAGRWWSYLCDDPTCCPADGTEIPPATDIAAAHALLGRAMLPSRSALREQMKPVEFVARREMEQALDRADGDLANRVRAGELEEVRAETVALAKQLFDRYAASPTPSLADDEAARIIAGLGDVHARDRILASAFDRDLDAAQRLFIDLCRRAVPPGDAPTCTLLAGLAYADGNGALANVAVERALESEPDYSLARLFRDALYQQVPPSLMRKAWNDGAGEPSDKRPCTAAAKKQKKPA